MRPTIDQLYDALRMAEGTLSSLVDGGATTGRPVLEHLRATLEGSAADENPVVTLSLNVFDAEGNQVLATDGETPAKHDVEISESALRGIVDHAAQFAIAARHGLETDSSADAAVRDILPELDETLSWVGVIPDPEDDAAPAP